MKRIVWALPVVAAWVLFCLPAWGADGGAAELPKDMIADHWAVTLAAGLLPVFVKFFGNETIKLPYLTAKMRVIIVLLVGAAATAMEQYKNGVAWESIVTAALATTLPALLIELLQKKFGGGEAGPKSMRPPAMFPPAMLGVIALVIPLAALPGCASMRDVSKTVRDVSSEVIADVQDAVQVLDVLRSIANAFFLLHSSPEAQAKVEQGFAAATLALNAAHRTASGAKQASDSEYDLAFANFRVAYQDLVAMLQKLGIVQPDSGKMGAIRSAGGALNVPEPRAALARVKQ
jgi:hypothetical protein